MPRAPSSGTDVPSTEDSNDRFADLDLWSDQQILEALADGQQRAIEAVRQARQQIAAAAQALADGLRQGGRLVYAGAGSSISIAVQDGAELPGTFGLSLDRIHFLIAGGTSSLIDIDGPAEDDDQAGTAEATALKLQPHDVLIGVSASGRTRYTVAAADVAKQAGATVIGIASNMPSPLLSVATHPIHLATGAEVIAGSTRMGAGTAQKSALGLLSTLAQIRLGNVYGGMMVNVQANNEKLRQRAIGMVRRITHVDEPRATEALRQTSGHIKPAVLLCAGAKDLAAAEHLLRDKQNNLRLALEQLARA
ncbi:MAG TPA: N-acetylmuramic acid 6-phosphate etherase [Terriglobales bacterium]|nr:N-acetylmuramic acid 6-phosphate etherase [Terriglobales bacterium]